MHGQTRLVTFGTFEVDLASGELRKSGRKMALQEQPFRILVRLLESPGQVVTRDELQRELWPDDTFVGFEQGLNAAVRRLREALGDTADSPRFIETLPRRGYRFIAPVTEAADGEAEPAAPAARRIDPPWLSAWALVVIALVGAAAVPLWRGQPEDTASTVPPPPGVHTTIELPADAPLMGGVTQDLAWPILALSRDGRQLAYIGQSGDSTQVFLRATDGLEVRAVPGTEGAVHPFFSPDGQWLGFLTDDKIMSVPVAGGTPATLGSTMGPVRAQWFEGSIYVMDRNGVRLQRIPEGGGESEILMTGSLDAREDPTTGIRRVSRFFSYQLHVLPGEKWALGVRTSGSHSHDHSDVMLVSLNRSEEPRLLVRSGYSPIFAPPDRLLFVRGGSVFAVRFDPVDLQVTGEPVLVAPHVAVSSALWSGTAQMAVSDNGLFLYASGGNRALSRPAWVGEDGRVDYLPMPAAVYIALDLSPDGARLALHLADVTDHVLVYGTKDFEAIRLDGLKDGPLARPWHLGVPAWSPDGRDLALTSWQDRNEGPWSVEVRRVDDPGFAGPKWVAQHMLVALNWTPDGKRLAFNTQPTNRFGFAGAGESLQLWPDEPAGDPAVSPNGRWVAFNHRGNVHIRSYPDGGNLRQVSTNGGYSPVWCGCGDLFYMHGGAWYGRQWMRVTFSDDGTNLKWSRPRVAFHTDIAAGPRSYDISPDGKRLLVLRPIHKDGEPSKLHLRANWMQP
jgi:DNA-binding winged helix-turn-helix (wHTH) protein/Tol biopolymer transport system component